MQVLLSTPVLSNDKLIKINGWTFLSSKTAGWSKSIICHKIISGKMHEWSVIDDKYVLNIVEDMQHSASDKKILEVDCIADVMKHCIDYG